MAFFLRKRIDLPASREDASRCNSTYHSEEAKGAVISEASPQAVASDLSAQLAASADLESMTVENLEELVTPEASLTQALTDDSAPLNSK